MTAEAGKGPAKPPLHRDSAASPLRSSHRHLLDFHEIWQLPNHFLPSWLLAFLVSRPQTLASISSLTHPPDPPQQWVTAFPTLHFSYLCHCLISIRDCKFPGSNACVWLACAPSQSLGYKGCSKENFFCVIMPCPSPPLNCSPHPGIAPMLFSQSSFCSDLHQFSEES